MSGLVFPTSISFTGKAGQRIEAMSSVTSALNAEISDALTVNATAYGHRMWGRGDWLPPQIVKVTDVAPGSPQLELVNGRTKVGGRPLGSFFYVDAAGVALTPTPGCVSSITFPYGGASAAQDPACYQDGAIPVMSYRHTHYDNERAGITIDADYSTSIGGGENVFKIGLWYEDFQRYQSRDWHKITDARVGYQYDNPAYWVQFDQLFPRETINYYFSNTYTIGDLSLSFGMRQFDVRSDRIDNLGVDAKRSLRDRSSALFSTGFTYDLPVDGLELFGSFSQNVKPLTDAVLANPVTALGGIESETADNVEVGIRYLGDRFNGSVVYFDSKFDNRLEFFTPQLSGNIPNYLIGTDGRYDNVGGIKTSGLELSLSARLTDNWAIYSSYTYTDATYLGTGLGAEADQALGLNPGKRVVGTAENMFVFTIDWTRNNYSAGLSTKFVDDRFINRTNTSKSDAYTVADFYLTMDGQAISNVMKGYNFGLVVNNVTNESYLGGIAGFGAWIGAPRTTAFTMTLDF
jgi:iron complex outermembrane recepter protein